MYNVCLLDTIKFGLIDFLDGTVIMPLNKFERKLSLWKMNEE